MDDDDWTPADIGIETPAMRDQKMLAMDSRIVCQVLSKRRFESNIFFVGDVDPHYCMVETAGGLQPAEKMEPRMRGKPPWRSTVATAAEAAPIGRAYTPYYRKGS